MSGVVEQCGIWISVIRIQKQMFACHNRHVQHDIQITLPGNGQSKKQLLNAHLPCPSGVGNPGFLHQSVVCQILSPHMATRDQMARSSKVLPSDPARTHAEAGFAAFSASSKRVTNAKVKLPLLGNAPRQCRCKIVKAGVMLRGALAPIGAESSWPHGVGTRPVSEPSTNAFAYCNSMTCATDATAAAMLRNNSACSGQPRTLPIISSSSNTSSILDSHGRLKAQRSVTPTSWQVQAPVHWSTTYIKPSCHCLFWHQQSCFWQCFYLLLHVCRIYRRSACCRVLTTYLVLWLQELVTLANKARGMAGTRMHTVDPYLGSTSTEDLSIANPTDQEEHLLRQFLSPKVCQPPSQEANCLPCCQKWPVALVLQQQNICWACCNVGCTILHWFSDPLFEQLSIQCMTHLDGRSIE